MPTSLKDAFKLWEEKNNANISEATDVILSFQMPPIEKLDNSLSILTNCEKLSLSSNSIEKITGFVGLKNLKILSLSRNLIKSFSGLEPLGDTLEQLWISYNMIDKIKGVNVFRNLKVLYMSNNLVKDWAEFQKLQEIQHLEDLVFVGNPLVEGLEEDVWRKEAVKKLPGLKKLDGEPVIRD
ncbi:UNVERIFIED_CONTAM: hypothetical protein PYX00_002074 [Menopon gallinae]|uniref:Dynein axonemal light chain 1 n=1 Tax=Menopon gallinae TaxID=328185 RepID=A0AAW2IF71_9NEOP